MGNFVNQEAQSQCKYILLIWIYLLLYLLNQKYNIDVKMTCQVNKSYAGVCEYILELSEYRQ